MRTSRWWLTVVAFVLVASTAYAGMDVRRFIATDGDYTVRAEIYHYEKSKFDTYALTLEYKHPQHPEWAMFELVVEAVIDPSVGWVYDLGVMSAASNQNPYPVVRLLKEDTIVIVHSIIEFLAGWQKREVIMPFEGDKGKELEEKLKEEGYGISNI